MTLTLSGTQENFSEIIKGTPSMAAKEERGNGVVDTTSIYEFRRHQAGGRRPARRWCLGERAPGDRPCSRGTRREGGRRSTRAGRRPCRPRPREQRRPGASPRGLASHLRGAGAAEGPPTRQRCVRAERGQCRARSVRWAAACSADRLSAEHSAAQAVRLRERARVGGKSDSGVSLSVNPGPGSGGA